MKLQKIMGLFWLLILSTPLALSAQSPFSAAYRVNASVITHYEIDQMGKLLASIGTPADQVKEASINFLINDRLIREETIRFGFEVEPVLIQRTLDGLGGGNPGDGQKFRQQLNARGVTDTTIDTYVSNQIMLRSLMDARGMNIEITDEELITSTMNIPDQVTRTVRVAEIALPFAAHGGRLSTRLLANEIEDSVRSGQSFFEIARNTSASPTRANGGRLPPIPLEALNGELASLVRNTRPGGFRRIDIDGAIIILYFIGYGEVRASLPRQPKLSYVDVFIPANGDLAKSVTTATQFYKAVDNCDFADAKGGKRYDQIAVSSLSSGVSIALARIETGERAIMQRDNGTSVLYLCDRSVAVPADLQQQVDANARNTAMENRSRGLLQELRNVANIVKVK